MQQNTGKWIIGVGIIIILIGVIIYFAGDKFHWIGRLPGDIRIENENTKVFIPITTMILFSVILSLVMWIIRNIGK